MDILLVVIAIFLTHKLDFATAFVSRMPPASKASTHLKIATVGTKDENNREIMTKRQGKDSALATDFMQLASAQKASNRLKLGGESEAKRDTQTAATNIVLRQEEIANPIPKKKILIGKKKDVGTFQSSRGGDDSTASSSTRSLIATKTAAVIPAAVTVSDDNDIFDTIMIASLETEKAGKADDVRELCLSAQTSYEKLIKRPIIRIYRNLNEYRSAKI